MQGTTTPTRLHVHELRVTHPPTRPEDPPIVARIVRVSPGEDRWALYEGVWRFARRALPWKGRHPHGSLLTACRAPDGPELLEYETYNRLGSALWLRRHTFTLDEALYLVDANRAEAAPMRRAVLPRILKGNAMKTPKKATTSPALPSTQDVLTPEMRALVTGHFVAPDEGEMFIVSHERDGAWVEDASVRGLTDAKECARRMQGRAGIKASSLVAISDESARPLWAWHRPARSWALPWTRVDGVRPERPDPDWVARLRAHKDATQEAAGWQCIEADQADGGTITDLLGRRRLRLLDQEFYVERRTPKGWRWDGEETLVWDEGFGWKLFEGQRLSKATRAMLSTCAAYAALLVATRPGWQVAASLAGWVATDQGSASEWMSSAILSGWSPPWAGGLNTDRSVPLSPRWVRPALHHGWRPE